MSFGSRRFLSGSGRTRTATTMTFTGGGNLNCSTVSINDTDGNTVLGTGTYTSNNNLRTNVGTGGFVNAPMVIELTAGRVYSIAVTRTGSGYDSVPRVRTQTNVNATNATITLRYGRVIRLSNPPELFADIDAQLQLGGFSGQDLSSNEPYDGGTFSDFVFDNAGWSNDRIIVVEGLSVPTTDADFSSGESSNHTAIGLSVNFNVAQSGFTASAVMAVEVTEGYFL